MNPRIPLALGALLLLTGLAACSSAPPEPAATPVATADAGSVQPEKTSEPEGTPTPEPKEELTCANLISQATAEALTAQGWTTQEKEFQIGDIALTDGLLCMWADFSTASDHGQMYGWSEIDESTSTKAQQSLSDAGWLRSTDSTSVYFTEDPNFAISTDEDGFGLTYQFGEGWVKFADTKQGLLLIDGN